MRIRNHDFSGAAGARAGNSGIGISGHPVTRAFVIVAPAGAGRPAGRGFAPGGHARDAFHVDGDQDLHRVRGYTVYRCVRLSRLLHTANRRIAAFEIGAQNWFQDAVPTTTSRQSRTLLL